MTDTEKSIILTAAIIIRAGVAKPDPKFADMLEAIIKPKDADG